MAKPANQRRSLQTRFSFGATSAIITNLGLIVALYGTPNAKISIIGGVLAVALADNISDSFGIHIYQESERLGIKEVWLTTATNFITRIVVSLVYVLLVALLPIKTAALCSVIYGLALLSMMSYFIAKDERVNPYLAMAEHLAIAGLVIFLSDYFGGWLASVF